MAEAVVFCVLERLNNLLVDEARFLSGVKGQVEKIQRELETMRSFLKNADARQDRDEMIRKWVADVRKLAYDIEDVLEIYAFKIPPERNWNTFLGQFVGIFQEGMTLHQVGSDIQSIRIRISELTESMRSYGIPAVERGESSRHSELNRSYHHVGDQDFVGLEGHVENLVERLVKEEGEDCHRVVSICGMGGIGKSTIARKLYHHHDIQQHFQAFAWASVSQQWQSGDVLVGILRKLSPERREEVRNLRDDELVEELYRVQQMKRCLLVIDDVWSSDFWDFFQAAFPNENSRSKMILTTRNKEIAMQVDPTCYIYEPRFLNAEESWELLKKKAFPRHNSPDPRIVEDTERMGREMAAQCGGLPLAIIVLGGILLTRSELNDWEDLHRHLNLYLRRGRGLGEYGTVYEVLALSYQDLPYNLKPCFLHLGNFQEDYTIPARKLIQLWSAEGFISLGYRQGNEQETMMDVGERYLDELAQRCMVQVQVEDSTGRIKSCRVHDLMRDVCLKKGKEENFLKIISGQNEHEPGDLPSTSSESSSASARRLSVVVSEDLENYFPPKEPISQVRSALFLSRLSKRKSLQSTLALVCIKFRLLRVLDLENFSFGKKLPKAIGDLICLRYISFRDSQFAKLPSSIEKLRNLQTLDLRVNFFSYLTMPNVIWKLQHLRHLYLPPSHGNANKLQLRSLTKLETLKNFDTQVFYVRDLIELTKLRKLSAIFMLQLEDLEAIIQYLIGNSNRLRDSSLRIYYNFHSEEELTLLRQLLNCHHLRKLDLIGGVDELPDYKCFSSSLTTLTLRKSVLEEDPMVILERIPRLRTLSLRGNAFSGKKMLCSKQGFPQLRTLQLEGLLKLKKWKVEEAAMPNLLHLEIDGCEKLTMVPDGLRFVTSIKELVIANMPDKFKRRLKVANEREGEDFHKIQHISSITFTDTRKDVKKHLARQQTGSNFSGLFQSFSPSTVPREWQIL